MNAVVLRALLALPVVFGLVLPLRAGETTDPWSRLQTGSWILWRVRLPSSETCFVPISRSLLEAKDRPETSEAKEGEKKDEAKKADAEKKEAKAGSKSAAAESAVAAQPSTVVWAEFKAEVLSREGAVVELRLTRGKGDVLVERVRINLERVQERIPREASIAADRKANKSMVINGRRLTMHVKQWKDEDGVLIECAKHPSIPFGPAWLKVGEFEFEVREFGVALMKPKEPEKKDKPAAKKAETEEKKQKPTAETKEQPASEAEQASKETP